MGHLAARIQDTVVEPGQLGLVWLGGAAFAFKSAGNRIIYIDPYLSDSLDHYYSWKRLPTSPIFVSPDEVAADLVLTTHAHEDHLDPESIPGIAKASQALFAGPRMCAQALHQWGIAAERMIDINRGESRTLASIPVSAVLAHHVSPAGAQTPDAVGFILDLDGIIVYYTGDTLYHPELQAVKAEPPIVLLVRINGKYGNMNPEEAARLTNEIEPAVVIPMQWGLVAENTVDPAAFVGELAKTGSHARPVVIAPGDLVVSSFTRMVSSDLNKEGR